MGRNLFPSTPILKKYSAAEASLGTWIISKSHFNHMISNLTGNIKETSYLLSGQSIIISTQSKEWRVIIYLSNYHGAQPFSKYWQFISNKRKWVELLLGISILYAVQSNQVHSSHKETEKDYHRHNNVGDWNFNSSWTQVLKNLSLICLFKKKIGITNLKYNSQQKHQ